MVKGDFNGDGLQDFALLLVGSEKWLKVSFHAAEAEDYEGFLLEEGRDNPRRYGLSLLEAGDAGILSSLWLLFEYHPVKGLVCY